MGGKKSERNVLLPMDIYFEVGKAYERVNLKRTRDKSEMSRKCLPQNVNLIEINE